MLSLHTQLSLEGSSLRASRKVMLCVQLSQVLPARCSNAALQISMPGCRAPLQQQSMTSATAQKQQKAIAEVAGDSKGYLVAGFTSRMAMSF